MRIAGAGHAFPPRFYTQADLLTAAEAQWGGQLFNTDRLAQLFNNVMGDVIYFLLIARLGIA